MKFEYQVRMRQRHLDAIVKALKFRQQLLSDDLYGTLGKVAKGDTDFVKLPTITKEWCII